MSVYNNCLDKQQRKLLHEWLIAVRTAGMSHHEAEIYYSRMNKILGIPVIIVTTAVGTTVFSSISSSPKIYIQIIVGLCSMLAAILASLQTFLGYSSLSEKHQMAGDRYNTLRRDIESILAKSESEKVDFGKFSDLFLSNWSEIEKDTPSIPHKIQDQALDRIRKLVDIPLAA